MKRDHVDEMDGRRKGNCLFLGSLSVNMFTLVSVRVSDKLSVFASESKLLTKYKRLYI